MKGFLTCAGIAAAASVLAASAAMAAGAEPNIAGIWWTTTYSPKILVAGGGDPPLNAAGKTQYQQNQAGLKDGSLIDKARKVCIPDGVPRVLETPYPFEIFQVPVGQITMIHELNHQLRVIALGKPLGKYEDLAPFENYNGYSVGHYEGDTLVIDTVGIKTGPYTMVDQFGTPHTQALHVIENYRLIDYEAANQALERGAKENASFVNNDSGVVADLNAKGKHLQLEFTVEDAGAFTTPWSATVIYRPGVNVASSSEFPEAVCAENPHELARQAAVPIADKSDF